MKEYSLIDLHTHTVHSKEPQCTDTVTDVLRDAQTIAERSGKDALIAITDHNAVSGISEAKQILASGQFDKVKLITGAEFSVNLTEINKVFGGAGVFGENVHILGYGFDENNPDILDFADRYSKTGKKIKYSELVKLMKSAGGKIVIAHPGLIKINTQNAGNTYKGEKYALSIYGVSTNAKRKKTILRYLPGGEVFLKLMVEELMKMSDGLLVGMERFHPDNYDKGFDAKIDKICQEFGLIQTAGSDFHGYRLHTEFSVGNPFTERFQEFYKETLQDSMNYRNGLHLSHTNGVEVLTGEGEPIYETKMITANGEGVTLDQYNCVKKLYDTKMAQEYNALNGNKKRNQSFTNTNKTNNQNKKKKKKNKKYKHKTNNNYVMQR